MVIIIAMLFLVFTGRYLVKMGHEISIEVLKNLIQVETEGNYEIDFDEVTLSIRKKKLAISGLTLLPIPPKDQFEKTIYEVRVDSVLINLESLSSIYFKRELAIDSIRIIDPSIRLTNPDKPSDKLNFSLQTGNLYQLITDQLAILRIGKFHIKNADLTHAPSNFNLSGFDFSMDGLLMDSLVHEDRVFFSTHIVLEINDQVMLLPDSIHEVGFEKFLLSTSDSVLRFQQAFIRPSKSSGISFHEENDINVYDVSIPNLGLVGMDYFKAYNDNVFSVGEVYIRQPQIQINNEQVDISSDASGDNNILKLLTQAFDSLQVGKFDIEGANVDIKLSNDNSQQRLSSKRTNIYMYGISLDSSNAVLDESNKYFDSASVTLLEYSYNLPDSIHQLSVNELTLNSSDSSILISELRLAPVRNPNSSKSLVYLEVPRSSLTGVNFKEALIGDRLRLRDFFVDQPSLRLLPDLKRQKDIEQQSNFTPDDLFKIINIRYEDFFSRSFRVRNAQLSVEEKGNIADLNLSLSDISLDKTDNVWTDLISELSISTGEVNWQLDTVAVHTDKIAIKEKGRSIFLSGFQLGRSESPMSLNVEQVEFKGHKPNRLVNGDFYSDTLKFFRPSMKWSPDPAKSRAITDSTGARSGFKLKLPDQIGYIVVEKGELNLELDSSQSITIGEVNLKVSSDENQPIDLVQLSSLSGIGRDPIPLSWNISSLNYDRLSRNLIVEDLFFDGGQNLRLQSKQLILTGIYQKGLLNDQYLLGSRCFVDGLETNISAAKLAELPIEKSDRPTKVSFGQVLIDNQSTAILLPKGQLLTWESGTLAINDFSTTTGDLISDQTFLLGKNGSFTGNLSVAGGNQQVHLIGMSLNSEKQEIGIDSLSVGDDKQVQASFKGLNLKGYSIDSFLIENRVSLGYLSSQSSEVSFIQAEDQVTTQILNLPYNSVSIDSLHIANNQWTILDQLTNRSIALNDLDISSEDVRLDSLTNIKRWFSYMKNISVRGEDFVESLGDSYEISVADYAYDLEENKIELNKISLNPYLDKYVFSKKLTSQKSWYRVDVENITVTDIDYEALSRGRYQIKNVALNQVNAEVYRDKNIPFPVDQYRAMPQKALHALNLPVWIDTVSITAAISYNEKPINSDLEGVMTFDNVEGFVINVRMEDTLSDQPMLFLARGDLFNQAPFNLRVRFDQQGPNYPFQMQGSVSEFDLVTLNQMLGPVAGVNIRSGYGEKIEFNFSANDKVASGDMRFRYDDLKIDILNKKTHEAHGLGRGIKTFFANTFVVKKKNSGFAFFVKKGQIFYERDTSRAIFNYWGKALISGAVSSIGINKSSKAAKKYQKSLTKSLEAE